METWSVREFAETLETWFKEPTEEVAIAGSRDLEYPAIQMRLIDLALREYYNADNWLDARKKLQPGV